MVHTVRVRQDLILDKNISSMAKAVYVCTVMSVGNFGAENVYMTRPEIMYAMYGKDDVNVIEQQKFAKGFQELIEAGYISAKHVKSHYIVSTENLFPDSDYTLIKQSECNKIFRTSMRNRADMFALYLAIICSLCSPKDEKKFSFDNRTGSLAQNAFAMLLGISITSVRSNWKKLESLNMIYTFRFKGYKRNNIYGMMEAKSYIDVIGEKQYREMKQATIASKEGYNTYTEYLKEEGEKEVVEQPYGGSDGMASLFD